MRRDSPCRTCDKRTPECHGTCEAYIAYDKENQILRDERLKQRMQYEDYILAKNAGIERMTKIRKHRNK